MTDTLNNQECKIFQDIQNVGEVETETYLNKGIKRKISETDYCNSKMGNNKHLLGKFELVEIYVKKEIKEELINEGDLEDINSFEDAFPNDSKTSIIKIEENEDKPISADDSIGIETGAVNNKQMLGKFEINEIQVKKEINEELIIKEDLEDSNISGDGITNNPKTREMSIEERVGGNNPSNDSTDIDSSEQSDSPKGYEQNPNDKKLSVHKKSAKQVGALKQHQRSGKKSHTCSVCQRTFSRIDHFKSHQRIHSGEKPYSCHLCQKSFARLDYLKNHERIHIGNKPYSCDVCQKSFTQNGTLNTHKRIHSAEKPFNCEECQKSFTQLVHFQAHKRTHSGEKPYSCDVCQKSFTDFSNFNSHKRTHSGNKPHTCDVCHISFTRFGHFKIHKRIHSGEKPYSCPVCQKSFARLDYFKTHERIHIGNKPFTCDVCQKSFIDVSNFKKHKRTHSME